MKLVVAGHRHYKGRTSVFEKLDSITGGQAFQVMEGIEVEPIEIVSGGAKGVDAIAKEYAESRGFKYTEFPANWAKYGKAAGPIRNKQMADYGDYLIAFCTQDSKGTKNMISQMIAAGKSFEVVWI